MKIYKVTLTRATVAGDRGVGERYDLNINIS